MFKAFFHEILVENKNNCKEPHLRAEIIGHKNLNFPLRYELSCIDGRKRISFFFRSYKHVFGLINNSMNCKICSAESDFFADGIVLYKYQIKYYKCKNCGFLQTEEPYWLAESYKAAINRSDVGYVYRNIKLAEITGRLIKTFFAKKSKFLDFGGGYGMFVRLMRDRGFNFYRLDKYCQNLFSVDFEAVDTDKNAFGIVTAFEVFEHLPDPINEIETMLSYSENIFFTTVLHPFNDPKPGQWWYYGEEHGQHVSIFSKKSLEFIARKYRVHLCTNNKNYHLLTKSKKNNLLFNSLIYYSLVKYLKVFSGNTSLLDADFNMVKNRIKDNL